MEPRYDQQKFDLGARPNQLVQILSPDQSDEGVWIYQNAWFNLGKFTEDTKLEYTLNHLDNGVYIFVLKGDLKINGQQLSTRDGFGIWNTPNFSIEANAGVEILLMEVPMGV